MIKKLILVGCTTQNNKMVNGQSMMFQLFVDKLKEKQIKAVIVDFGKSIRQDPTNKRVSGEFSYTKLIDNFLLVFRYVFVLLTNFGTPIYMTTSQSKVGFVRDYIFIKIAKFFGRKVVAHQFGSNYDKFFNSQTPSFQKKIINTFEKFEKIIVEGDFTKNHFSFLKDYREKVISIPNGLPEKVDSQNIVAKKIDLLKPLKIIYLSNLIESKGYWDVLEAFNLLVNRDKRNIEAIFSGKFLGGVDDQTFASPELARKEFFKFIEENKLTSKIEYFEGLFGENKAKAFRESYFFLLPSYYINEGQPVSIIEALAYGCVPVVTKYRLIPDMVNNENGFFVNAKSPEEIAAVINKMIDNPLEYAKHSEAGINYYLNNFTADKHIDHIINLF
ncbi:glycosyltransferase family 4 protein [Halpernia sp. GG3]